MNWPRYGARYGGSQKGERSLLERYSAAGCRGTAYVLSRPRRRGTARRAVCGSHVCVCVCVWARVRVYVRGVKFPPLPLTFIVALTTLSHYRASVWQETVSGSGISWAVCKSAPRSRQITMPAPHHSVFTGRMLFVSPNQQRQSTEGTGTNLVRRLNIISSGLPIANRSLKGRGQGQVIFLWIF